MQTIEEEAAELYPYNEDEFSWSTTEKRDAFENGAEFAQRWIPVEDELPEDSDDLVQTEKYIYTENAVLVRTVNGKYSVSKRSKFKGNNNSKWEWMGSSSFSDSVTHWRPIKLK